MNASKRSNCIGPCTHACIRTTQCVIHDNYSHFVFLDTDGTKNSSSDFQVHGIHSHTVVSRGKFFMAYLLNIITVSYTGL